MTAPRTAARKAPARKTTSTAGRDATRLLTDDHKEVHGLFVKYNKLADADAGSDERQPLAEQICVLLTVHATIEEEIFYPAARAADVDSDLLDEAEVEHASAKALIAQIREMDADDDLYDAKVKVLGEYIDHHVEEEQDELFPKCRKSAMDLKQIGAQLAGRKAELMSEMAEGMEVAG
jgi:hemerythrin superfamily protein